MNISLYTNNVLTKLSSDKFSKMASSNCILIPYKFDLQRHLSVPHSNIKVLFSKFPRAESNYTVEVTPKLLLTKCFFFDCATGKQPVVDPEKPLCLVNFYDADVSWAQKLRHQFIIMYKEQETELPFSCPNKAKSETNLLRYIIDNYDNLPVSIINLHQYNYKHYIKSSTLEKVNSLDDNLLLGGMKGYYGINDYVLGSVARQINPMISSGWWGATMEATFGPILTQGDFTQGRKGCAQFVVARENILSLPRAFYHNMYSWLISNSLGNPSRDKISKHLTRLGDQTRNPNGNWWTSRYMEWSWELIFTRFCARSVAVCKERRTPAFFIVTDKDKLFCGNKIFGGGKAALDTKSLHLPIGAQLFINGVPLPNRSMLCVRFGDSMHCVFETDNVFVPILRSFNYNHL